MILKEQSTIWNKKNYSMKEKLILYLKKLHIKLTLI